MTRTTSVLACCVALVIATPAGAAPTPPVTATTPAAATTPAGPTTVPVHGRPARALDELVRTDGTHLRGQIVAIAEGAYVTFRDASGLQTLPWADIARLRLERDPPDTAIELSLAERGFEVDLPVTVETPRIEMLTRDGKPTSLLRLRSAEARPRARYSTGFDEVCRAPCRRPVQAGSRRFFVDSNPWTTSRVFDLPPGERSFRLLVRPGRVGLRKAGLGLMISGAVGFIASIFVLASPKASLPLRNVGITVMTFSGFAIPTGGIVFGVSRTRVKVAVAPLMLSTGEQPR
jgi:hypothetical protein